MKNLNKYTFLLILTALNVYSLDFNFDKALAVEERKFIEKVTNNLVSKVPKNLIQMIGDKRNKAISLKIIKMNKSLKAEDFCTSSHKKFGYFNKGDKSIALSETLFKLAFINRFNHKQNFTCLHKTYEKTLEGVLVHELAHLYDDLYKSSKAKSFKKLIGGIKLLGFLKKNAVKNENFVNSPDAYEFKNAKESFAVNFEYYILDRLYQCKKPAFANYFNNLFEVEKALDCNDYKSILIHSSTPDDNLKRVSSLNIDRVYEVHYLHADKGPQIMSKWGHAMFRVIVCAPHRNVRSKECLKDIAHHLVLSYRANIADISMNYISGVFGKYPSQLLIYSYPEIITEYARYEFRNLYSIPLKLSNKKLENFLDISLERYWNYVGKYYFVTNNCGTESLNQMKANDLESSKKLNSMTPKKILKTLKKTNLVDLSQYEDILSSKKNNLYFVSSKESEYQEVFKFLQSNSLFLDYKELSKFNEKSRGEERSREVESYLSSDSYKELSDSLKKNILFKILKIEKYAQFHEQKRISSDIFKKLKKKENKSLLEKVKTEHEVSSTFPWQLVDDSEYGVPSIESIKEYQRSIPQKDRERIRLNKLLLSNDVFSHEYAQLKFLMNFNKYLESLIQEII